MLCDFISDADARRRRDQLVKVFPYSRHRLFAAYSLDRVTLSSQVTNLMHDIQDKDPLTQKGHCQRDKRHSSISFIHLNQIQRQRGMQEELSAVIRIGLYSEDRTLHRLLSSALGKEFQLQQDTSESAIRDLTVAGCCDVLILDFFSNRDDFEERIESWRRLLSLQVPALIKLVPGGFATP